MFHELNCTDSCLFPSQEEVLKAIKEEWGFPQDEVDSSVDRVSLGLKDIIRGRRNKRASYVSQALKQREKADPKKKLTPAG